MKIPSPSWTMLLALAGAVHCAASAAVVPFDLLTAEEVQQEREVEANDAGGAARLRSWFANGAGAPSISVVAPRSTVEAVHAPLRIELAFSANRGARIVPESFRVLYGMLKIDLTPKLREFARISESGVIVEQAQVPEGQHRLFVQIGDDRGNVAEAELRLNVVP